MDGPSWKLGYCNGEGVTSGKFDYRPPGEGPSEGSLKDGGGFWNHYLGRVKKQLEYGACKMDVYTSKYRHLHEDATK